MEKILIDMHAHTKDISLCCQLDAEHIIKVAYEKGIQGLILTNHYQKSYYKDDMPYNFAKKYIGSYEKFKTIGKDYNILTFFGIELTAAKYADAHILIYGVDEDFILQNSNLCDYALEEIYIKVHEAHGIVVQAHPYRNDIGLLNFDCLDGIEINCHPKYPSMHFEELSFLAKEKKLILTCGGDYHGDTSYRPKCGVFFPASVKSITDIVDYLKKSKKTKMLINELRSDNCFLYTNDIS